MALAGRTALILSIVALAAGQDLPARARTVGASPAVRAIMAPARDVADQSPPASLRSHWLQPVRYTASLPMPRTRPLSAGTIHERPLQRIQQLVPGELIPYFDLYIYVNKAPQGVSAQHMYIYERLRKGDFHLKFRWRTSTGRERQERYFTTTPTGIYKLDPGRFYRHYNSRVWDGVPMPFAMFLDFGYSSGRVSGIAIHGTHAQRNLGRRASGGCIRLAMENARFLFYLIKTHYGGNVPKFAWNSGQGHTSKTGMLRRDDRGKIVMERGYRVLVIVDNFGN